MRSHLFAPKRNFAVIRADVSIRIITSSNRVFHSREIDQREYFSSHLPIKKLESPRSALNHIGCSPSPTNFAVAASATWKTFEFARVASHGIWILWICVVIRMRIARLSRKREKGRRYDVDRNSRGS